MSRRLRGLILSAIFLSPGAVAAADDQSVSPYIDQLKKEIQERDAEQGKKQETESYTEKLKRQLKKSDEEKAKEQGEESKKPYIEQLKEENPELRKKEPDTQYLEQEREKLPKQNEEGAIEAYRNGRSELHAKKRGEIKGAFGFKLGVSSNKNIT